MKLYEVQGADILFSVCDLVATSYRFILTRKPAMFATLIRLSVTTCTGFPGLVLDSFCISYECPLVFPTHRNEIAGSEAERRQEECRGEVKWSQKEFAFK